MAFFTSFILIWLLAPYFMRKLKKKQIKEEISSDGPKSHQKKKGTPTMGGGLVLFSLLLSAVLWVDLSEPLIWGALIVLFSFWCYWLLGRFYQKPMEEF